MLARHRRCDRGADRSVAEAADHCRSPSGPGVEGKLPGVSGERPDVAEHPAGAQRPKFLLTARPCEPSVGGDGRRRRAPTDAAAVGVMWRVLGPDIVRIAADVPSLYVPKGSTRRESSEASFARRSRMARFTPFTEAMEMRSAWCDTNERREWGGYAVRSTPER